MAKGQAFLNVPDKTARGEIRHLNVVISDPDGDNNVMVVPVSTYREKNGMPLLGQDQSCLIPAGCHHFIRDNSYIRYQNAKIMNPIDIFNGLNKGKLARMGDFDLSIVQKIQEGAKTSPFLPGKFKKFFKYF